MKIIDISNFSSKSDIRQEIYGVLVTKKDGVITMIATDSYKLAKISYRIEDLIFSDLIGDGIYLPKSFSVIVKLYNSTKDLVEKKKAIEMLVGAKSFVPVEKYPKWEEAIPKNETNKGLTLIYDEKHLSIILKTISTINKELLNNRSLGLDISSINENGRSLLYRNNRDDIIILMARNK